VKELEDKIGSEIARRGAIPFADFMRLALYCPVYGYYETEKDRIGARGDFYTSASTGALFGQLLAFQLCAWFEEMETGDQRGQLAILEAGAHDGVLAKDILAWIREHRPAVFKRLEYRIIEPSVRRQTWQKETLADFLNFVRWTQSIPEIQDGPGFGSHTIVFCNELLDALPTHRVGWNAQDRTWFEWGVVLENERFVWQRIPLTPELQTSNSISTRFQLTDDFLAVLPDNFTIEIGLEAEQWWCDAVDAVKSGNFLTFDYGLERDEFFLPHRHSGTLRAYYRHHVTGDLLARPGDQDITAHVNFTALHAAGEARGLLTKFNGTQAQFLTRVFSRISSDSDAMMNWASQEARQFQTLTHPDHLGRALRVLVQARK
jgi:SAM-dependent MidA family methyltransferase